MSKKSLCCREGMLEIELAPPLHRKLEKCPKSFSCDMLCTHTVRIDTSQVKRNELPPEKLSDVTFRRET